MKYPLIVTVNETFEVYTPESIEVGEAEERGFSREKEDFSVEELIDLLEAQGYTNVSSEPMSSVHDWISSEPSHDRDYFEQGREVSHSLHLVDIKDAAGTSLSEDQQFEIWKGLLTGTLTCDPSSAEGRYGDRIEAVQSAMIQALRLIEDMIDLLPRQGEIGEDHPLMTLKYELMAAEGSIDHLDPEELVPDLDKPASGKPVDVDAPLRALAKEIQSLKARLPELSADESQLER